MIRAPNETLNAKFNLSDKPYTKFGRSIYVFNNPECSNFSEPISSCHQSIIFILVCMPKYASRGCALKPLSDLPTGKEGLLQRFHCPQSNAENKKNIINLVIIII